MLDINKSYKNKEGHSFRIISYINKTDITIEFYGFENIVCKTSSAQIQRGSVKNPLNKSVYSIGSFGIGVYKAEINKIKTKEYNIWHSMLKRCYSNKIPKAYIGCTVHPEWHNFQVFAEWCNKQSGFKQEGWHLDKDILVKGNREYGPDACCFVPGEINTLFTDRNNHRGNYPIGVDYKAGKYRARCSVNSKSVYLGDFETTEKAFNVYKEFKEKLIISAAEQFKNTNYKLYEALNNYKIEITD